MKDMLKHFRTYAGHILTSGLTRRSQPLHTSAGLVFPSWLDSAHWAGWDRLALDISRWVRCGVRNELDKQRIKGNYRPGLSKRGLYCMSIILKGKVSKRLQPALIKACSLKGNSTTGRAHNTCALGGGWVGAESIVLGWRLLEREGSIWTLLKSFRRREMLLVFSSAAEIEDTIPVRMEEGVLLQGGGNILAPTLSLKAFWQIMAIMCRWHLSWMELNKLSAVCATSDLYASARLCVAESSKHARVKPRWSDVINKASVSFIFLLT